MSAAISRLRSAIFNIVSSDPLEREASKPKMEEWSWKGSIANALGELKLTLSVQIDCQVFIFSRVVARYSARSFDRTIRVTLSTSVSRCSRPPVDHSRPECQYLLALVLEPTHRDRFRLSPKSRHLHQSIGCFDWGGVTGYESSLRLRAIPAGSTLSLPTEWTLILPVSSMEYLADPSGSTHQRYCCSHHRQRQNSICRPLSSEAQRNSYSPAPRDANPSCLGVRHHHRTLDFQIRIATAFGKRSGDLNRLKYRRGSRDR